ncbi:MAG: hypothetical protein HY042_09220, partial [Spirochaetia bacterium]|nr:hypothetical protein [Spirochaetia bacterium]
TAFFALLTLAFLPFGQEIGRAFSEIPPARAYLVNLTGSLTGVAVVTGLSAAEIQPVWQLAALCITLLGTQLAYYQRLPEAPPTASRAAIAGGSLLLLGSGFVVWQLDLGSQWSVYHKLTVSPLLFHPKSGILWEKYKDAPAEEITELPRQAGFNLSVNDDYFQMALDLSDDSVRERPYLRLWRNAYDQPFQIKKAGKVLIVAGGTGNDAAAAVRAGVPEIDVVDIEGHIMDMGRAMHPEKPYSQPGVQTHTDDARSFFHKTQNKYDLIIFSYLDSHRLFSQMSNIRLDSFLYTKESLAEARALLRPGGVLYVHSAVGQTYAGIRIGQMMRSLYGHPPLILKSAISPVFVGVDDPSSVNLVDQSLLMPLDTGPMAETTDDWPFIYLKERGIPREYLVAALLIPGLVTALAGGLLIRRKVQISPDHAGFFLLGAAFFLLETKAVTDAALLFGSTWAVNSVVITSVLSALACAALTVIFFPPQNPERLYVFLLGGLALLVFLRQSTLLGLPLPLRIPAFGLAAGIPIYFSSLIFTAFLRRSRRPDMAFAVNLLGSFAGGCMEYFSMSTGFRMLTLFAMALAAGSYGLFRSGTLSNENKPV